MRLFSRLVMFATLTALLVLGIAAPAAQSSREAEAQLKAAVQLEEAVGNLTAAIEAYRKLSTHSDRAVAAQALLRLAGCQEKLGQAEAQKTYQQVISQFGDQTAVVAEARRRVAGPTGAGNATAPGPFKPRPPDTRISLSSVLSPDGTLAIELRDGALLVERNVASGRERVLLDSTNDRRADAPAASAANFGPIAGAVLWSPDGTMIAFARRDVGNTKSVSVQILVRSTGEVRTVAVMRPGQFAGAVSWTTKGEVLYSTWGGGPARPSFEFHLVSSAGGESRRILSDLPLTNLVGPGSVVFGDLTPDGARAIVIRSEHLALIDVAEGTEAAITLGIGVASPKVSPDGRLLAYLSKQTGTWGLYVAPLDQLPIRSPVLVANLNVDVNLETWRNPRWIGKDVLTYDYVAGANNVYRIEMDQKAAKSVGRPEQLSHQFVGSNPIVSPDGRHIAYTSAEGGVILMDADGSHARRLTEPGTPRAGNGIRGWRSADEIMFVNRHKQDGNAAAIRVVNIKTGELSVLRYGVPAQPEPNWQVVTARNELFYRQSQSPDTIVARSLVDGTERTVLTLPRLGAWIASPDGGRILAERFTSKEELELAVHPAGSPAGAPAPLVKATVASLTSVAAWAPDGNHVMYSISDDLRVGDVRTGQSWSLFDNGADRNAFLGPETRWGWETKGSWSPDGSWVAAAIWHSRTARLAFEGVTYDAVSRLMKQR